MMKLFSLATLCLSLLVVNNYDKVAHAADVEEEDDILVLTDSNYKEVIESYESGLLVEFYAPWCGHCKSLAPEYAKAAAELKKNDPPIRIAKVDATEHKEFAEAFEIKGFPTLKYFRGTVNPKDVEDYEGGRTSDGIQKWILKKSGPAVNVVKTDAEIDALKTKNEVVIVLYANNLDGEERLALEKIAAKDDSAVYVVTNDADVIKAAGKTAPALTLFKQFDEGVNHHDGAFTQDAIAEFIKKNARPLIMTFSQEKASQIFGGEFNIHLLMFSDESSDYHEKFMTAAKVPATENKGKMLHILIPVSEDRILDYFGYKEADLPAVVLVNMEQGMKKFNYNKTPEELKASFDSTFKDDITKFEADYFDGKLKPTLKSAEPIDDAADPVKTIVGKSFVERVVESDKDVLLEFYAPWCGHCKNLAPKYEELAEKFSSVDSIMIAKMDATENEVDYPGVDVKGFPTLIFFPAMDKANPFVYKGDREVKGFTEFLKKNAKSFELDGESHGVSHDEL